MANELRVRKNALSGTLAQALAVGGTVLNAANLVNLPAVDVNSNAAITIYDDTGQYEVVRVTAHTAGASTATASVTPEDGVRPVGGWPSGTKWRHGATVFDWQNGPPIGAIYAWPGTVANIPENHLQCAGQVLSRTIYALVFAKIGTTYNTGGEAGTDFRLPNTQGCVIVGLDPAQTEFDTIGEKGGAKTVTITTAMLPAHAHTASADSQLGNHTHAASHGHTASSGGGGYHQHYYDMGDRNVASGGGSGVQQYQPNARVTSANGDHGHAIYVDANYFNVSDTNLAHGHNITVNNSTGGGGATPNLQPYIVMPYIIRVA